MKQSTYDFRQFQEELAALDRKNSTARTPEDAWKTGAADRLAQTKAEFTELRKRYRLTIAHVIAFFPEKEGIAYLQRLIAEQEGRPRLRRKSTELPAP